MGKLSNGPGPRNMQGVKKKIYVRTELGKESKMGHVRRLGWW